jgi:hypothetical protein
MTITFVKDNDVIIYALEKVISYARGTQQIFVAQCVWWLASVIGLESGLVSHIDELHGRTVVSKSTLQTPVLEEPTGLQSASPIPKDLAEELRRDTVLKECEQYLRKSRKLRDIVATKSKGKKATGRINPTPISKKALRKKDRSSRKEIVPSNKENYIKTEGIDEAEIQRRRSARECLRCAWPADRKGTHRVKDCNRPIKLEIGTAGFPKSKDYQKLKQRHIDPAIEEECSDAVTSEESSSESA